MLHRSVKSLAEIFFQKGIHNIIISPGSRSAPITLALARHPGIHKYVVLDERSAGYIGLGMAQVLDRPVGLVCTSGTAAINLYPAIAEAYYLQIPLIVLTADRPPEWIDQHDGQTIHQESLYQNHIKASFNFPLDEKQPDIIWHTERIVSEAINRSLEFPAGPVHINLPFREPLYPGAAEKSSFKEKTKTIDQFGALYSLPDTTWKALEKTWNDSANIMIIGGQQRLDPRLLASLNDFSSDLHIPVLGDVLSNLHGLGQNLVKLSDLILWSGDKSLLKSCKPDLLITFGKSVISKNLKTFLRQFKAAQHWHLQPAGQVPDPFQSLTHQIPMDASSFFESALKKFEYKNSQKDYLHCWLEQEKQAEDKIHSFLPKEIFSELEAVNIILDSLPDNVYFHLANSMPVRLANYLNKIKRNVEVFSNRGTSGIDGCLSAAVGAAIQSTKMNVLITGDMSFFYDRNAFWHSHIPENLRILILNNHGGGIFRLIDGPSSQPELEIYFETHQPLSAENTAKDYGFEYRLCNNRKCLQNHLRTFYNPDKKVKILEIETDSKTNKTIFDQFKSQFI